MSRTMRLTVSYGYIHFMVDLLCAWAVFSLLPLTPTAFLIYNFCAFALQMPLGVAADGWGHRRGMVLTGLLLAMAAVPLSLLSPLTIPVAGLGNALFHVGGGTELLAQEQTAPVHLGIFVSPGALGIYLGALGAKSGLSPLIALVGAVVALFLFYRAPVESPHKAGFTLPAQLPRTRVLLLFLVVVLRSYTAMSVSLPWKTQLWVPLSVCAAAAGKALGGLCAERFGLENTGVVSLLAAAILLPLGSVHPLLGVLALLLGQMTMPVTLWAMSRLLPGGFAFGLLTFALFLGFLPSWWGAPLISPLMGSALSLAACGGLFAALRKETALWQISS